jgi:hypothetical protein
MPVYSVNNLNCGLHDYGFKLGNKNYLHNIFCFRFHHGPLFYLLLFYPHPSTLAIYSQVLNDL